MKELLNNKDIDVNIEIIGMENLNPKIFIFFMTFFYQNNKSHEISEFCDNYISSKELNEIYQVSFFNII